jgi:hypothetical protein
MLQEFSNLSGAWLANCSSNEVSRGDTINMEILTPPREHLYRSHAQPIFCPRCYAVFDTNGDFATHLRFNLCQICEPQPIGGIDRETEKNLRKRSPTLRLEEDKWRDTYHILFPDVSDADIPSPCKSFTSAV